MLPQRTPVRAYLGIGSNQGDRAGHLWRGAREICRDGVDLVRASSVYASAYVGPEPAQPEYLNAVLEVDTALDAGALLERTQQVERQHGRRPGTHMQPRPLDVDILVFGSIRSTDTRLQLPHPRLSERRFVLEPLEELGVLDELPVAGLRPCLQVLRQQQIVTPYARWSSLEEKRGIRI
jgi:2-amino-4-hydroxy-6-hydroxymethyldihydropteridine diphosphokinase